MAQTADVVVIGAGVVGCSVAYYLAREGVSVTLLERDAIGSGASAHATGSLSLLGAEFSPGPSFEMARASYAEFHDLVPELESATGMDLLYQRRPSLRLALDDEEAGTIRELMAWQQPHVSMRWIDGQEVRSIEPRLSHSIIGAVYEDESAQLDSYRLNLAMARGAELKGASILYREVTGPGLQAGPRSPASRPPRATYRAERWWWPQAPGAERSRHGWVSPFRYAP